MKMKYIAIVVFSAGLINGIGLAETNKDIPNIATFSIVAYDSIAGEWGVAVQSRFLAVGAVVPFARAGIGAVASQAWGNTAFGPQALELMSRGLYADSTMKIILSTDTDRTYRQVGLIDSKGRAATYTGKDCQAWAGGIVGEGFCVQGNILTSEDVVKAMAQGFQNSSGRLAQRLLVALYAGQKAGGDKRGMQSAALLIVSKNGGYSGYNDQLVDLRVDDHPDPIKELERIFYLHEKTFQAGAYVRTGIDARKAGDLRKADVLLERAEEIALKYGDDASILNEVAWEMAINNFKLPEALELAEKAARIAPEDGNILDTKAEIFARMGDYKKAIEVEKKAYLLTKNPEFNEKITKWKKKSKRR
jgi:uncharacterized Ntn-hydrolase superfamily protein